MNDFDDIKKNIEINLDENKHNKGVKDLYGRKPIGDYIPYKIAQRFKKCVRFSVESDCRAPNLNIDDVSREMLTKG